MNDFPLDPQATCWTAANCYAMAQMSALAYSERPEINARCISLGFASVTHFSSETSDTQGFLAVRPDVCVLAFRGTEPDKLKDWLVDAQFIQRLLPGLGNVHRGFRNSYRSVHDDLVEAADLLRHGHLLITGHSRGAAEATLAAWSLVDPSNNTVRLYTFGSPRLMDKDAAETFGRHLNGRSFRMVNNSDGVTRVPTRLSNHWHIDEAIVADADGVWCRGTGWWTRLLERVQGDWTAWVDGHDLAIVKDHKISEYVRVAKLNYERSLNP